MHSCVVMVATTSRQYLRLRPQNAHISSLCRVRCAPKASPRLLARVCSKHTRSEREVSSAAAPRTMHQMSGLCARPNGGSGIPRRIQTCRKISFPLSELRERASRALSLNAVARAVLELTISQTRGERISTRRARGGAGIRKLACIRRCEAASPVRPRASRAARRGVAVPNNARRVRACEQKTHRACEEPTERAERALVNTLSITVASKA